MLSRQPRTLLAEAEVDGEALAEAEVDGEACHGEQPESSRTRAKSRHSVLERFLRSGPFEARRTAFSVALASSGECTAKFNNPEL